MLTEYVPEAQLEQIMEHLPPTPRLVCEVCLATGLRVGDVVSLRKKQLGPTMTVQEAKTGKSRVVHLDSDLVRRLKRQAGRKWVFPGAWDPGKHRTRQGIWRAVKRASRCLDSSQNVAPHSLRKVYAVRKLDSERGNLRRVQEDMGHDRASTTLIYAMARELYEAKYGEVKGDEE